MGKIYVVMGKSATGKDTIYKHLLEDSRLTLDTVVTYTTRPIRSGEKDGVEYFFVDEEKLKELDQQGKIIEHRFYDTVLGRWHYFTVDDGQINLKEKDYLMITTLEGYEGILKCFGREAVVPLYIEVEDGLRLERALLREKMQEEARYSEVCRRYLADEADFDDLNLQKLGIQKSYENKELPVCLEQIIEDIQKEKNML